MRRRAHYSSGSVPAGRVFFAAVLALLVCLAPHALAGTVLDLAARSDLKIVGADDRDETGVSLASGDWNGDGIADLAVGAWLGDSYENDRRNAGEVYLFLGRRIAHVPAVTGPWDADVIYGTARGDRFGTAIATGDWDGDGISDLAIAARFSGAAVDSLARQSGQVTILYGGAPPESARVIARPDEEADLVIWGADEGDRLGQSILFADLDGDKMDDLLISAVDGDGAKNRRRDCGEVTCIWGRGATRGHDVIDMIDAPDWRIDGADENDGLGRGLAAADVDADGRLDLIITANFADGAENALINAGESYLLFGGPREVLTQKKDLARDADCIFFGGDAYANSGVGVGAGDFDGDGFPDIAIAADMADDVAGGRNRSGAVYVVSGRENGAWKRRYDLEKESDLVFRGKLEGEQVARTILVLDWNGDRWADLAVGANLASAAIPARERAGMVFVVHGRSDYFVGANTCVLDDVADRVIEGAGMKDQAGYCLARGPITPTGPDRLLIGAPFADGPRDERVDAGEIYVISASRASAATPNP